MKIFLYLLVFTMTAVCLNAQVAARVGPNFITYDQLLEEFEFTDPLLTYSERRQAALDKLIREEIILIYAEQNRISVSEFEVENYFVRQFSDHPRFTTDGRFDYMKFDELKRTPQVQKILYDMQRELTVRKTESIIKNEFSISDEQLLEKYIIENAEIDISYGIITEEQADVPEGIHPRQAIDFYWNNQSKFMSNPKVKLKIAFLDFEQYETEITISEEELRDKYFSLQNVDYFEAVRDSLKNELIQSKTKKLAENDLKTLVNQLRLDVETNFPVIETHYLESDAEFNSFFESLHLYTQAVSMDISEVSAPVNIGTGYLVFKLLDKTEPRFLDIKEAPDLIWRSYVEYYQNREYANYYREYFYDNIELFTVPAVYSNITIIDKQKIQSNIRISSRNISEYYKENTESFMEGDELIPLFQVRETIEKMLFERELKQRVEILKKMIEEYIDNPNYFDIISEFEEVISYNDLLYLDMYKNQHKADSLIVSHIESYPNLGHGRIETEEMVVYYVVQSFFPEYLPTFELIQDQIYPLIRDIEIRQEEVDYLDYYQNRANLFFSPDSLQVSGILVKTKKDFLEIDSKRVRGFYDLNAEMYLQPESVSFKYIFLENQDSIKLSQNIYELIKNGADFNILHQLFSARLDYNQNIYYSINELNQELRTVLSNLEPGELSSPFNVNNGWLILKKQSVQPESRRPFYQVVDEITDMFRASKSDSLAFEYSKAVYDTLTTMRQLNEFAREDSMVVVSTPDYVTEISYFRTPMLSAEEEFPYIGYLHDYKRLLLRLRNGERLQLIMNVPDGYAVVFLNRKKASVLKPYEEVEDLVKETYMREKRSELALNLVRSIREDVINGEDPEQLFIFFGGWHSLRNLSLTSKIPFVAYQDELLDDIINREEGDISHIIRISENEYTFYKVDRKKRISRERFLSEKEEFRNKIISQRFENWIDNIKKNYEIIVF